MTDHHKLKKPAPTGVKAGQDLKLRKNEKIRTSLE